MTVLPLTREAVVARALAHLTFCERHPKAPAGTPKRPVAYRLDDSGLLGGDDPRAPHCADWSYGLRTPTADCVGFALYCAGLARRQPGYQGLNGEWLNTDSIIADAIGQQQFFAPVLRPLSHTLPGDLLVSPSTFLLGKRLRAGHVGVIVRPAQDSDQTHGVIDCSPRHGRATAIGFGYPWSDTCRVVRPKHYRE